MLTLVKVRLHWMQSDGKQPKFDVIDNLQKVATGRKLRERLLTFTYYETVVEWLAYFEKWRKRPPANVAHLRFAYSVNAPLR